MSIKFKIFIACLTVVIILASVTLYGLFIGAKVFKAKEYGIRNTKITESYNGFKIAHISDIHYKTSISKHELEKIVKDINKLKPDIIVLTGDLVDMPNVTVEEYKELIEVLSKLEAKINKYAIEGNHDYRYKKWITLIEDSGFINLNDTYDLIYSSSYEPIFIAGISSNINTIKNIKDKSESIFNFLNSDENNSIFNILLIHEPDYIEQIDYKKFNLILAGHSHNGQIRLPFIGAIKKVEGAKKYYKEYYSLGNTDLYISSGIGTTFIPIRLFNRPSYNFYRIQKG